MVSLWSSGISNLISDICSETGTWVTPSSWQVTLTSTTSPTDLERTFKKRYSISKVDNSITLTPFVKIQAPNIAPLILDVTFFAKSGATKPIKKTLPQVQWVPVW